MNWKLRLLLFPLCIIGFCALWRFFDLEIQQLQETSLCSCDKCLADGDLWLNERLTKAVEPFFLSANYTPSVEGFNWWRRIQNEWRDYNMYVTIVKSLFEMFPPRPDVLEPSPDRCRSCAVVGNSANLKGSHYGALIDFHDIVIRMNHGPTKGYEEDVGTKTTHHVMYPESSTRLDNTTHLVLFPFKIKDLLWLMKTLAPTESGAVKTIANKDLVMILNPTFMKYVHEIWLKKKGRYPSTGFLTLVLSLHMCDEVDVFGFGADRYGSWSHYFEVLKNKNWGTGPHSGMHEYKVIETLHQQQIIRFFKGY